MFQVDVEENSEESPALYDIFALQNEWQLENANQN